MADQYICPFRSTEAYKIFCSPDCALFIKTANALKPRCAFTIIAEAVRSLEKE